MKAVRVHDFGDGSVLRYEDVADLVPGPGQAVMRPGAHGKIVLIP
jgi:NADPH:quinone reductase-like Zn-dependent oxidoreductase